VGAFVRATAGLRLHAPDSDLFHFAQPLEDVAIHGGPGGYRVRARSLQPRRWSSASSNCRIVRASPATTNRRRISINPSSLN
jgi:hypothetical protein